MEELTAYFPKILISAVCSVLLLSPLEAQIIRTGSSVVVKIDSTTRLPDNPIPFDQYFSIVLTPRNPKAITKVFALPLKRAKDGSLLYDFHSPDIKIKEFHLMGPQLVIDFYPIKSGSSFDLYIERMLDSANLDTFVNFVAYIVYCQNHPGVYDDAAKTIMHSRYYYFFTGLVPHPNQYPGSYIDKQTKNLVLGNFYYDFLFERVCNAKMHSGCSDRSLDDNLPDPVPDDVEAVFNSSVQLDPAGNFLADLQTVSQNFLTGKLNDQTITSLIRIWSAGKADTLAKGLISIDYQDRSASVKPEDMVGRKKNYQVTVQRLSGLLDTLERLQDELPASHDLYQRVIDYVNGMTGRFADVKKTIDKKIREIGKTLADSGVISYPEYYVNNNDGFKDLTTASSSYLSPQVGLSFLGMTKNMGGYSVVPKITLGVNINWKPINKNLPRKDIPDKDLRNYLSAFFGVTFGGFSDSEYSNLLSSASLVGGLNWRIAGPLYFSFGGAAFKQQNKNPVINSFHPAFGVYASLLIDLDLTSAASSVVSIFTK